MHYFRPEECLKKFKKEKNISKPIAYLLVASVFFAISAGIMATRFFRILPLLQASGIGLAADVLAVVTFLAVFLGGIFMGWIVQIVLRTLNGKGGYFHGLAAVAYPLSVLSIGFLIAAVFSFLPSVGGVVALVSIATLGALAFASFYRFTKELFEVDMVTAFVGVSIVLAVLIFAVQLSLLFGLSGLGSILSPY